MEEWSGCSTTEAKGNSQVDGMKFWRSPVQLPSQSRPILVQVSCAFACLSLENLQGQRCYNLNGIVPCCLLCITVQPDPPKLVTLVTTHQVAADLC